MRKQEAVPEGLSEDECLARAETLASIAALEGRRSTIGDSLKVGGNVGAIVSNINNIEWLVTTSECSTKLVVGVAGVEDGGPRKALRGGGDCTPDIGFDESGSGLHLAG